MFKVNDNVIVNVNVNLIYRQPYTSMNCLKSMLMLMLMLTIHTENYNLNELFKVNVNVNVKVNFIYWQP